MKRKKEKKKKEQASADDDADADEDNCSWENKRESDCWSFYLFLSLFILFSSSSFDLVHGFEAFGGK